MRRQLINIKSEALPKAPQNFRDIISIFENPEIRKNYTNSKYDNDLPFYRGTVIEEDFGYSIFVSPTMCNSIMDMPTGEPRHYLIDGTFSVVPISSSNSFKQLLIFHIAHNEHTFPFIYILMSNKSLNAYIHVLQYIQSNIFDMKPTTFTTDFEYGLRKALSQIYPQTKLKTCWFHFTQAVRRNASKLPKFMSKLNKDNDAKKLFRKFLILPLLKPDDILIGYLNLNNQALSYIK
uniref:MULE transposase domain-containing protein n=2 Tax=Bactrocera latifrons TaxID=174628 RepID=A0A0K8W4R3_BACLA